ncbi:MAG: ribosome biogenesis GTPase Der [bacterium]|jgi:GTP-binding protein|nr:ribosome biogenesis GTPase Der [bacterium]
MAYPNSGNRKKSLVAIVGRPNVGKSTLFNRIIGQRVAIVDDQPGVTRDSNYRPADWNGKSFTLVDTGGFFGPEEDPLTPFVQEQIELVVQDASVLVYILDAQQGPTPADAEILDFLRRQHIPLIAAVNKVDNVEKSDEVTAMFYELGLADFIPISASHGMGVGDLLDEVVQYLPDADLTPEEEEEVPKIPGIAILGRPNVGKSTLLNSLCGQPKAIVSPIAGTTRDPVDTEIVVEGKTYLLIDTAGIRRRGQMKQGLDKFSMMRCEEALRRCDAALLLIDGEEGLTERDAKVFSIANDMGKAVILLVNKWDVVEKDTNTAGAFAKKIREDLPYLKYAPIEFISAMTKQRIHRIFPHVEKILENYYRRVPTGELNRLLEDILAKNPPPVHKGRLPRIYYWTQASVAPPTFIGFVNEPSAIHFSYERYLINRLYENFDFEGTPIRLFWRKRKQRKSE